MMHGPINIRFTDIHFLSHLAHFVLEWEMWQTEAVENTHFICSNLFRKSRRF